MLQDKLIRFFNSINKVDNRLLIFILLCVNYLSFEVIGNMDQYLSYLKFDSDSNWFPNSYWFNEFSGTRWMFQKLFGWAMHYLTFEQTSFWGKLIAFITVSFPLGTIFKKAGVSNISMMFFMQTIWLSNQSLFAGGWMVKGFETKVFSYFFVLLALLKLMNEKPKLTMFFLVVATYFHLLVGGWITISILIYMLLEKTKLKQVIAYGVVYFISILPLLVYMYYGTIGMPDVESEVSINWIYTYYRNPHHTAPFKSIDLFFRNYFWGILISIAALGLSLKYRIQLFAKNTFQKKLTNLLIATVIQQIVMLVVAVFDREGVILKTYPFRTSVITMLLLGILLFSIIDRTVKFNKFFFFKKHYVDAILIMVTIAILSLKTSKYESSQLLGNYSDSYDALTTYVSENTNKEALIISLDKELPFSFMRKTQRNQFVVGKIIPSDKVKIVEWYKRIEDRKKLIENINFIDSIKMKYDVTHGISKNPIEHVNLNLIYENEAYHIYELKD
jgi:hypothetical protein